MIIAITIPVAVAIMCGAVVINAGAQNKKNEATKDIDNKR